ADVVAVEGAEVLGGGEVPAPVPVGVVEVDRERAARPVFEEVEGEGEELAGAEGEDGEPRLRRRRVELHRLDAVVGGGEGVPPTGVLAPDRTVGDGAADALPGSGP